MSGQPLETKFEFSSEKFPALPGEEEQINPGLWGRRLADYLKLHLETRGYNTGPVGNEDWGVYFAVGQTTENLWIGCGHMHGEHDTVTDRYTCFVEPASGVIRKWLRKTDVSVEVAAIADAVFEILNSDPDIHSIERY